MHTCRLPAPPLHMDVTSGVTLNAPGYLYLQDGITHHWAFITLRPEELGWTRASSQGPPENVEQRVLSPHSPTDTHGRNDA